MNLHLLYKDRSFIRIEAKSNHLVAVLDQSGKLVMESVIETKAATILEFVHGLRGSKHLTFEEGAWIAWLYDLLKPHVTEIMVCDPRKNALLKTGDKSDRIDARKLADLLRGKLLSPVYHGESGVRSLRELARTYLTITRDVTRVMNRIKALYRSWAIPSAGQRVYDPRHRSEWLRKLSEPGVRRRAECFYQQLDSLQPLRQQARRDLLAESRKHEGSRWLCQIPCIGPIRTALLMALLQTPHRFRTKRQLWACGLALETRSSGEFRFVGKALERCKKPAVVRGLNKNHHADLKYVFKSTASAAIIHLLRWPAGKRDETQHGPSHLGAQDRGYHSYSLEERSTFRPHQLKSQAA